MLKLKYLLKDVLIAKIRTASKFTKAEMFAFSVSLSLCLVPQFCWSP